MSAMPPRRRVVGSDRHWSARLVEWLVDGPPKLPNVPEDSAEFLEQEVEIVMHLIIRRVGLLRTYTLPAIGAAFAMHLVAIFSKCVADGHMTSEQAQQLILRIAQLEFDTALIAQALKETEKNS